MSYLSDKKKSFIDSCTFEEHPVVKVAEVADVKFLVESVRFKPQMYSKDYGASDCVILEARFAQDPEIKTVFVRQKVLVEFFRAGLEEGHDFRGEEYAFVQRHKKGGQAYWDITDAETDAYVSSLSQH